MMNLRCIPFTRKSYDSCPSSVVRRPLSVIRRQELLVSQRITTSGTRLRSNKLQDALGGTRPEF